MKYLFIIIYFLLLIPVGCSNSFNTENEIKGIQEVADFYGGQCQSFIGIKASSGDETERHIELVLSESEGLESYKKHPDYAAGNIAYRLFNNLKGEEENYDTIKSTLLFKDKTKRTFDYSVEELKLIRNKLTVLTSIIELIKTKDYFGIDKFLHEESIPEDQKIKMYKDFDEIESEWGKLKDFTLYGFKMETVDGYNVLKCMGVMSRAKKDLKFSVNIDMKISEDRIHFLGYGYFL